MFRTVICRTTRSVIYRKLNNVDSLHADAVENSYFLEKCVCDGILHIKVGRDIYTRLNSEVIWVVWFFIVSKFLRLVAPPWLAGGKI